jgi:murein DD-endopeptidase MepM/ murein hydrolase activator NlpD
VAAVLAVMALFAPAARAQVGQDDASDLQGLENEYDEAVAQEEQLLAEYDASVARLADLNAQIVRLNESIATTENELLTAEQQLSVAQDDLHVTEVRLAEVEAELDAAEERLHQQAVESYILGGDDASMAAALLQAETIDEYKTTRVYGKAIITDQDRVVREFVALRDEADGLRRDARSARDASQAARDDVVDRQAALVADRDEFAVAQADAFVVAAGQEQLIADAQERKADYLLRISVLQGTSDSITSLLQARQRGQSLPNDTVGIFGRPVPGGISSGYGPRLHPIFGELRQHNGLDMGAGMGQPVAASADGVVGAADARGGYGNVVVVDHGNALATVYAHLSSFNVNPGDPVRRGQILGGAGSTGFSTGPHLHWEVRVFGVPVDPRPYLET